MQDNTDCWVLGMGYVVGGFGECTASSAPNLLWPLAQVFPEPGRGTINARIGHSTHGHDEIRD